MTKDRVGAGLAALAAIIGLWLVFQFPQSPGDDDGDDAPAGPATGQIAPAPGVLPPGQVQPPAPGGQVQQPQAPTPPDADGDDDDGDG
ncbi:hypothetical protein [Actinomycetospora chibensis]|uniref:Uncharacterized protein n=1 Tax=Actinomycetospora chibensis TaxID=663606 RepID=A0ABV9RSE7_9PSEU|nr:hypothetical protein [Actinomycetospora chibensis]MDD7924433.1 hypothetical protein [Actinomycetospora chibensis]